MGICKCAGERRVQPLERYEVAEGLLGIAGVTLVDHSVNAEVCQACGGIVGKVQIPDLPGLIAAVAITRAKHPLKLNGKEMRFLRKALEVSAADLASLLEVTTETISRWENEKQPIGPTSEKLLRVITVLKLQNKAPAMPRDVEAIANMTIQSARDVSAAAKLYFHRVNVVIEREKEPEPFWRDDRKAA
jgi:DNA-binding transcriptional regulator YiaG